MSTQTGLGFVHGGPGCDRSHHLPNEWMLWAFASPQPACPGSGSCHMHPSWGSFSPHPSNSSSEKLNHTRFTLPDRSVLQKSYLFFWCCQRIIFSFVNLFLFFCSLKISALNYIYFDVILNFASLFRLAYNKQFLFHCIIFIIVILKDYLIFLIFWAFKKFFNFLLYPMLYQTPASFYASELFS